MVSAVEIASLVCIVLMDDGEVRRVVDLVVVFAEKYFDDRRSFSFFDVVLEGSRVG